jgi:hypothetical protein
MITAGWVRSFEEEIFFLLALRSCVEETTLRSRGFTERLNAVLNAFFAFFHSFWIPHHKKKAIAEASVSIFNGPLQARHHRLYTDVVKTVKQNIVSDVTPNFAKARGQF